MSFRSAIAVACGLLALAACTSDVAGPPPGTPGLAIVSGGSGVDSIGAVLAPLVVELRDGRGRPVVGEELFFGAGLALDPLPRQTVDLLLPPPLYAGAALRVRTDGAGRAEARVRLGTGPGAAWVTIHSARLGLADTARYTVLAGGPARVRLAPRDTVVYVGSDARLRASVTDRAGNPVPGTVSYAVLDGPGTPGAESGVVRATSFGTVRVVARVGPGADTVAVGAVPEGALAGVGRGGDIFVVNLDGSRLAHLGRGSGPSWSPDGSQVVFASTGMRIVAQPPGGEARLFLSPDTTVGSHYRPRFSRDGAWLYFFTAVPGQPVEMWRAPSDGSGRERITPRPVQTFEGGPAPSPDGRRIAYFAEGGLVHIRVRDLVTGESSGDLARGHAPAWSPVDDLIAYTGLLESPFAGPVMLMRPDGSGVRRLSPPGLLYHFDVDFSPDGRWIVATRSGAAHLIEVATGTVVELPFVEGAHGASWRPTGLLP